MEKEEFANLVISSEQSLYYIAKAILKRDEDCQDAVQEAIVKAFSKLSALKKDEYAKTWLTRIVINECKNFAKKQAKCMPFDEDVLNEHIIQSGKKQDDTDYSNLYQALGQLKKEFRVVLVLYYVEEYTVEEIAGILRLPTGTVKSRLSRGRSRLRTILKEMEEMEYEKFTVGNRISGYAKRIS
ncbi:MAG: sigma-70 family RNA polymerase sigma factor [Clostridiales bacterium]|nr:sigma-70 family RNA polymerase sigma factor [Clostridiales bacterium]